MKIRPYSVYLLNCARRDWQLRMQLSQNSVHGVGGMVPFSSNETNLWVHRAYVCVYRSA